MNWQPQALSLIKGAPAMIQPMIRRRIESLAVKSGLSEIDEAFVKAIMDERHSGKGKKSAKTQIDISEFYAAENADPLTAAFEADNSVHVFGSGQSLSIDAARHAWQQATQPHQAHRSECCLYIHIPFCRSRCVFCPFYANRWNEAAIDDYADTLVREIEQFANSNLADRKLDAIYFGGGTPTDLSPEKLTKILAALHAGLNIASDAEITLEGRVVGHSEALTRAAIDGGVNRFSIGVQSFDTKLRRSLGRKASETEVIEFLNRLSTTTAAVVIDLIYGLPGQSMKSWLRDLRILNEHTDIHGVDLYRLKAMEQSEMQQMIDSGILDPRASTAQAAEMFAAGVETMAAANWERLSIPHWRRDSRERSRYNSFVKSAADCIPVGAGAGGRIDRLRVFQESDLPQYTQQIDAAAKPIASAVVLGEESYMVDIINAQLERGELIPGKWSHDKEPVAEPVAKLLQQWQRSGLLTPSASENSSYKLTVAGEFWAVQMGSRLSKLLQQLKNS